MRLQGIARFQGPTFSPNRASANPSSHSEYLSHNHSHHGIDKWACFCSLIHCKDTIQAVTYMSPAEQTSRNDPDQPLSEGLQRTPATLDAVFQASLAIKQRLVELEKNGSQSLPLLR
jgi:hypothetical protein